MTILRDVASELMKMFLADLRLSLAILATVCVGAAIHVVGAPGWVTGLVLTLGTGASIAAAILSAARKA
tara:strand:- start:6268 stop:6474 length:207 start_codon:yes stop_codon:yes gene_type:complete